jgi:hypothetical protein
MCTGMSVGCQVFKPAPAQLSSEAPPLPGQSNDVFTTERPTIRAAVAEFFGRRPVARQPVEFPHNIHIDKKISCKACHQGVERGPVASLPSVKLCMTCHLAIAADKPRIKEIAALRAKGIDLDWQRVYGFVNQSHVTFNHAAHVRAKVECLTCHGNVGAQTGAQENVKLTMGVCVNCHKTRRASLDCMTCHS